MKVFLSWSGEVSKQVAIALRDWLPNVIQSIEPWMSSEDTNKGSRWSFEIAKELGAAAAGIICVVPGNHDAPWLNFEAGALSNAFGKDKVCPYLFRVKSTDFTGPIAQFQMSEANRDDTHRLLGSLNKGIQETALTEAKLAQAFEMWWPRLEGQLAAITTSVPNKEPKRRTDDMLEELLSIARDQSRTRDMEAEMQYHSMKLMTQLLEESQRKEQELRARLRRPNTWRTSVADALGGKLNQHRNTTEDGGLSLLYVEPTSIGPDKEES